MSIIYVSHLTKSSPAMSRAGPLLDVGHRWMASFHIPKCKYQYSYLKTLTSVLATQDNIVDHKLDNPAADDKLSHISQILLQTNSQNTPKIKYSFTHSNLKSNKRKHTCWQCSSWWGCCRRARCYIPVPPCDLKFLQGPNGAVVMAYIHAAAI